MKSDIIFLTTRQKKNETSNDDYKVVVFDLYDIVIDILKQKGYLEKCYQFEKSKGFERQVPFHSVLLQNVRYFRPSQTSGEASPGNTVCGAASTG